MKRFVLVILALCFLLVWSVILLLANNIAEANPVIRRILQIKEKEVEIETIKTEYKTIYIEKEIEVHWYQFLATGYSPDDPSQGTNRTMATGKEVYEGAIAADPKILPLGSIVQLKGLPNGRDGIYIVEDVGGAIKGLHIDVYCESKFEALQINQIVWVRIIDDN